MIGVHDPDVIGESPLVYYLQDTIQINVSIKLNPVTLSAHFLHVSVNVEILINYLIESKYQ